MTKTAAIVLAGGSSSRFGEDKGLLQLAGKPLILHVLERIRCAIDERIVVLSPKSQLESYTRIVGPRAKIVLDNGDVEGPISGLLAGIEHTEAKYSILLPCDTPFVSHDILTLLLELCINRSATIPRWPNCYIEPLQAAYAAKSTLEAARNTLAEGKTDMQSMINDLRNIRYVSTLVLQQLDPQLRTFFNINTPLDLKKAEAMLRNEGKQKATHVSRV